MNLGQLCSLQKPRHQLLYLHFKQHFTCFLHSSKLIHTSANSTLGLIASENFIQTSISHYSKLLSNCCKSKSLGTGLQTHAHITKIGLAQDTKLRNHLINLYSKCRCFGYARKLLDESPEPDLVSWSALISGYAQNGLGEEALLAFHEMHLLGVKSGDLQDAIAVFEEIAEPDIVSWNAVIAGCILHEYHGWALTLLRQMRRSGTFPNMFTLSSALKACAGLGLQKLGRQLHSILVKMGIKLDPFASVGLIDMYSKCDLLKEARMVYNSMPNKDLIAFNAMISGHSQNGEHVEAIHHFADIYKNEIGFNQTTLLTILNSAASLQAVNICKQVHALSVKSGFQSDVYVINSLIDSYGKCSHAEDAARVFEECPFGDLASFTSMITAYAQYGQGEEAIKLYLKMQDMEIKPDPFVCSSLLNACANLSAYEPGKQIHVHVLKFGFISDTFAGNSLVNMYAKCGSVDDAGRAFSEIPERGIVSWSVTFGTLGEGTETESFQIEPQTSLENRNV
ncbi:tetratricopeptide repeat (TPR)-like superfamily protein [Actinidia rufa]|uniref:Tetratricopeptide repeat (TPR)-like superfamily protein n=1 Tax=Actinidia rufa TaxID=165716 RepID=A0A7J0FYL9_9ERIC|nr:tetratricopeptide repeat (TPR)-like superfamily protein [Actinidia rufa]